MPFENALKANPNDTQSLIEEAAVFDRNKLEANAVASYRKAAAQWPDAVWIRGRIFELEESLATEAAIKASAIAPDAKTYAMVVGISKYQKLPKELWLQYPVADADAFGKYLSNPAGGHIPADQMLVMTDEQATTAALRNSFPDVSEEPSRQERYGLRSDRRARDGGFAGRLYRDLRQRSAGSFLHRDADGGNPAVGRGRIVESGPRGSAGRSLPCFDHRKHQSLHRSASVVEKLGEAPGDMLGLMASRPKELGLEGSQFGGGHGAFTYSVLKALEGGADQNQDHSITAGELRISCALTFPPRPETNSIRANSAISKTRQNSPMARSRASISRAIRRSTIRATANRFCSPRRRVRRRSRRKRSAISTHFRPR